MAKVTVIGAGSWGTALAVLLCNNGHDVILWSHRKEQAEQMESAHFNEKLPQAILPETICYTSNLLLAAANRDLLVLAVPSTATFDTAVKIKDYISPEQKIVCVSKGISENALLTQCEQIEKAIGDAKVAVLSGPSHAEEVVKGLPTVVVAGAKERVLAEYVQGIFMNDVFRVYTSPDVLGIEIGASLKNVIALAAGMSDGLGFGDNTRAALITRGIREITTLAVAMGAKKETMSGLTGVGDLMVTCNSMHSRNHQAGVLIGQGCSPKEAMEQVHMVVEGVYSAKSALQLGKKYHIELPIIECVNRVLFEQAMPKDEVKRLMARNRKSELDILSWDDEK